MSGADCRSDFGLAVRRDEKFSEELNQSTLGGFHDGRECDGG